MEIITKNAGETQELGRKIGDSLRKKLKKNKKSILLGLSGDLGSGKTTITQGLAVGLGIKARLISPTFIIMREYLRKTTPSLYHIDLYRFPDQAVNAEIDSLGIADLWAQQGNVIIVEWAEKAKARLPEETLWIQIENLEENLRKFTLPEGLIQKSLKVYINTTQPGQIILRIGKEEITENNPNPRSQKVLAFLVQELEKRGLTASDISEVEVETGPGPFTGVRVGVSVANALGYAQGVPVNKKNIEKDGPISPQY